MLDLSLMQPLKVNFIIFIYSLLLPLLLKHLFKQNHKKINFLNRLKQEKNLSVFPFSFSKYLFYYYYSYSFVWLWRDFRFFAFFLYFLKFQQVVVESFFLEIFCFLAIYFIVRNFLLFGSNSRGIFRKSLYTCGLCVMYKYLSFFAFNKLSSVKSYFEKKIKYGL